MVTLHQADEPPVTSSPNTVAGFGADSLEAMPPLPKQMQWTTRKASSKSIRTLNPIRAIVDPIVRSVLSGNEREDGKSHISLAVRENKLNLVGPNVYFLLILTLFGLLSYSSEIQLQLETYLRVLSLSNQSARRCRLLPTLPDM